MKEYDLEIPSFLKTLNERQFEAVTYTDGSALILAGAGSGKTRVLTTRIAWLLHMGLANPADILAVTFTNKAAKEMMTRVGAMAPLTVNGAWIGTFHALCNRMLRAHAHEANLLPGFQILDDKDQQGIVRELMKEAKLPDDRLSPRAIQSFINQQKENGLRARNAFSDHHWGPDLIKIYAAYEARCQKENLVDFAELLLRSVELLTNNEILRKHYQQRFRYVLVDEFQDTNPLQYQWLKLLAGNENTVFAVGDDDQSIYSFRGADSTHMQRFTSDFHIEDVIRLEQNYRSFGVILKAANALISHNRERLGKELWTNAGDGEVIRGFAAQSDVNEARWVSEQISWQLTQGMPPAEIAVLYRKNALSRLFEHALFSAGIPYRIYGGQRFFDRQEIRYAIAYLRLIANPNDDTALMRVINFPPRGIGEKSIEKIRNTAAANLSSLFEALPVALTGRAATSGKQFKAMVENLRAQAEHETLPNLLSCLIDESGLLEFYRLEKGGLERVENLKELISAAATFSQDPDLDIGESSSILEAFLDHVSLEAGDGQETSPDAVQLMTIHASKGLEFDTVFLTGLEKGTLPADQAYDTPSALEEERRMMYVAITRAKRLLHFSFSKKRMLYGRIEFFSPSGFLNEIPMQYMSWTQDVESEPIAYRTMRDEDDYEPKPHLMARKSGNPSPKNYKKESSWQIGQHVHHAKFGNGIVLNIEGSGDDERVYINFQGVGSKWIAVAYAKLTPLS